MKRKPLIVAMLIVVALVVAILLSIVFKKAPVGRNIYIRSNGTVDPSNAEILRDGEVYTFTANVHESIVVQRNNTVIDGSDYVLQGNGTGYGIYLYKTTNVTIKNTKISGFSQGISLHYSVDNILINNTISNCVYGIISSESPNTTISTNIVTDNEWDGIFITGSDGSIVSNNIVANHSKWGIYLGFSAGSVLRNNVMTGNRWNLGVSVEFIHDIDTSNTLDGKPIYYWINQRDKQVPTDAGYVALINSTNITVRNLNLNKNGQGAILVNSKNCLIENSNLTKNGYYGIQLVDSEDNSISNNTLADNNFGVVVQHSMNNTINNNIIEDNQRGIHLQDSDGNTIYHNNFVNNTRQASSENSTNVWDNGYPSGGNYWSEYEGADLHNGPQQNLTGNDGIGDIPYIIDTNNTDRYPLTNPKSIQITLEVAEKLFIRTTFNAAQTRLFKHQTAYF